MDLEIQNLEHTLIIIKPHAVSRGLVGRILARFEDAGLQIAAVKSLREPTDFWQNFYPSDNAWFKNAGSKTLENCLAKGIDVQAMLGTTDPLAIGKLIKGWLVDHMTSDISIAARLVGNEAQTKVRLMCGATLPNRATPGTIRFDFSTDSPPLANEEKRPVFNLIHASDPDERGAVTRELSLVFGQEKN